MRVFIQINNSYETRIEKYNGEDHLVVPVVMMVEGVHAGSAGPMLHLAEDLGRYPETWNGIPVVVTHPSEDGQYISANSPDVLDAGIVGRVFNTKMDGEKLKSEVWLNQVRLGEISPEALAAILEQEPLDVSVGVFSDAESITDIYKGEQYESIARNFRPDHLALLPGEEGACSWNDGCGIRANSDSKLKIGGGKNVKAETLQMIKTLNIAGYSISEIENYVETGYKELIDQVWNTLQTMGSDNVWYYLEELYDDYLVYAKSGQAETQMYKQNYKNSDGTIEFVGDPVEVRKEVKFVVMEKEKRSGLTRTRFNNNSNSKKGGEMSEVKKTPCCEDLVNELITNKRTTFEEKDKEQLLTLSEDLLGKLIPAKEIVKEPEVKKEPEVQANAEPEPVEKAPITMEAYLETVPDEVKDQVASGLALHKAQRVKMIADIKANLKDVWSDKDLEAMNMVTLTKLSKSVPEVVDYSTISAGGGSNDNGQEHLLPAGIVLNEK